MSNLTRRHFIQAAGAAALAPMAGLGATADLAVTGKAEHCIFMWLGGGMSQIDTFDPKRIGNPKTKTAGTYYQTIETAVPGVRVTEHLPRVAGLVDRMTLFRSISHGTFDEHATATQFVHLGRRITETIRYPSIGSIVAHERGAACAGLPPYVLIGYPSAAREPGFLGPSNGYIYLTDTESGPAGFVRHDDVTATRQARRESLLNRMRAPASDDRALAAQDEVIAQSLRLAGPRFMESFDLKQENAATRQSYGGEFGQRCLVARRLIERGVRFIEVSHNLNFLNGTGWDIHNEGYINQHHLIHELDNALAGLVSDLENRKLLDRTLVVVATEFGRPPEFDGKGGRGHQSKCYTMVMAGGGLRHRGVYGVSDELSKKVAENPVSIPDFLATICAALNIDPAKKLVDDFKRPVPITDGGVPVASLFA